MSAELLREAAAKIREQQDIAENLGHIVASEFAAWLAVADWLDTEATEFERHMARQVDPDRRFNSIWLTYAQDRHRHALNVAAAYLGGP